MTNQYTAFRFVSDTHKECSDCGEIKPHSEFHKNKSAKRNKGLAYYCKDCAIRRSRAQHNRHKTDPEYKAAKRSDYFKFKYGLTLDQYTEKLKAQNNQCALCKVELPATGSFTHLDHCHKTGKLRDFLCTNCNRGLGHFMDNPEVLRTAADYIESHSKGEDFAKEVKVNESSH